MRETGGSRLPTVRKRRAVSDTLPAPSSTMARTLTVLPSRALVGTLKLIGTFSDCTDEVIVVSYADVTPPLRRTRTVLIPMLSVAFTPTERIVSLATLVLASAMLGLTESLKGGSIISSPLHAAITVRAPTAAAMRSRGATAERPENKGSMRGVLWLSGPGAAQRRPRECAASPGSAGHAWSRSWCSARTDDR